jgi:hypothetical protein
VKGQVEFGARIPTQLYEDFREALPMYGATRWFIVSCLREFTNLAKKDPVLKDLVRQAVVQALANAPSRSSLMKGPNSATTPRDNQSS